LEKRGDDVGHFSYILALRSFVDSEDGDCFYYGSRGDSEQSGRLSEHPARLAGMHKHNYRPRKPGLFAMHN